jgi:hypothetical protein
VSGFVTLDPPEGWVLAGRGSFHRVPPDVVEARGGPGILWYPRQAFGDFTLLVDWRLASPIDNSGVFVRIPPLAAGDWKPAVSHGYEIQIDDRGIDHDAGRSDSATHRTGAIYERAPALVHAAAAAGDWNTFEIDARGGLIVVTLNGTLVSRLDDAGGRRSGHLGLQAHDEHSRVQFRNLRIRATDS